MAFGQLGKQPQPQQPQNQNGMLGRVAQGAGNVFGGMMRPQPMMRRGPDPNRMGGGPPVGMPPPPNPGIGPSQPAMQNLTQSAVGNQMPNLPPMDDSGPSAGTDPAMIQANANRMNQVGQAMGGMFGGGQGPMNQMGGTTGGGMMDMRRRMGMMGRGIGPSFAPPQQNMGIQSDQNMMKQGPLSY